MAMQNVTLQTKKKGWEKLGNSSSREKKRTEKQE